MRKPFDVLAEGLKIENSRGDYQAFERVLQDYVGAFLDGGPDIRRVEEFARQIA